MIAYVKGELAYIEEDYIIVEAGGIGHRIFIPSRAAMNLPGTGKEVRIHTYLNVREDAMQLFGFLNRDDLNIFKLLIGVNGVGPKAALGILSALSADDLRFAILADDVKKLTDAPGIGKKSASKIILELKDKLKLEDSFEQRLANNQEADAGLEGADGRKEAVLALHALGYSKTEAAKAVDQTGADPGTDVELILKEALKYLNS